MEIAASGLVWYAAFLVSTTLHEAAHAWAAKRGGDPTAYLAGQVTLDPRPHIRREPFGMVVLPLLSALSSGFPIGFASAPYDGAWAARHPRRAAWMSLAGPASNLALALAAALAIQAGVAAGGLAAPEAVSGGRVVEAAAGGPWPALAFAASAVFTLNLLLGIFNLLPFPPLDGAGILPLVLPEGVARAWQQWTRQPALALGGIVVAWMVFGDVFGAVFRVALGWLHPGVAYR